MKKMNLEQIREARLDELVPLIEGELECVPPPSLAGSLGLAIYLWRMMVEEGFTLNLSCCKRLLFKPGNGMPRPVTLAVCSLRRDEEWIAGIGADSSEAGDESPEALAILRIAAVWIFHSRGFGR